MDARWEDLSVPIEEESGEDERGGEIADALTGGLQAGMSAARSTSILSRFVKRYSARLRAEDRRRAVEALLRTPSCTDRGGEKALEIGAAMRGEWWEKRREMPPESIAEELLGYARERMERERKRSEKSNALASKSDLRGEWVTTSARDDALAVCERTLELALHPERRGAREFPPPKIKAWNELSDSSRMVYKRSVGQCQREMAAAKCRTAWDVVNYLTEKARETSRSVYNRYRATIIQMARMAKNGELERIVRSMPSYGEICRRLERPPSPRAGAITRDRRKKKNENVLNRLMDGLSEENRSAVTALRVTGARVSELPTLEVRRDGDAVIARLRTNKTGCRNKKEIGEYREIVYNAESSDGKFLSSLIEKGGTRPFAELSVKALQSAWGRVREKDGKIAKSQTYTLHGFRHEYASRRKAEISRDMITAHGADWRRKLYGKDWRSNENYRREVYGELARELGHSNADMTRIYG